MIYLKLFLMFFKVGLFTFGGGYAMIPLITDEVVKAGYLTEGKLVNLIAVAESTPGPFAVNIATFVGSTQGGILGSVLATLGVVLPSFIIILLIAMVLKRFSENKFVKAFLRGVQPVIVGLILITGIMLAVKCVYVNFGDFTAVPSLDIKSLCLTLGLGCLVVGYKLIFKKYLPTIPLILISAVLGILIF